VPTAQLDSSALNFSKGNGLVTVIAQDAVTGSVLMIAHADREAIEKTLETGEMHYTSRTRGLWHKGATSGNVQRVVSLVADCDGDSILARVKPAGPACHAGTPSCFGDAPSDFLADLSAVIEQRATLPARGAPSYTQRLLHDRNLRLKKISEEASELVVACADEDPVRATEEAADLLYHMLVALRAVGVSREAVLTVLAER
jgi:phosphoribosyl-ATP pyrophosphohydrolase/phosphoribosyl-AMP cyclohydrolase